MGKMINGEWVTDWYGHQANGEFIREDTVFRGRLGEPDTPPEAGRYHLYVSYACPWAHRTLIVRALLGLDDAIGVSVVNPYMYEEGWVFDDSVEGATPDALYGLSRLSELYSKADAHYTGRVTVPILWDGERETIVSNESRDILRMLDDTMGGLGTRAVTLAPESHRDAIDETISAIYHPINNGVYRCGFAKTQQAYDQAFEDLFSALDHWDSVLSQQRYLCGEVLTEADVCLFTTLIRFDPVYHNHFKCNRRMLQEYTHLWGLAREIYQLPGVAETLNLFHIKEHYFRSHPTINPKRLVAGGPILDYDAPHDRGHLPGRLAERLS